MVKKLKIHTTCCVSDYIIHYICFTFGYIYNIIVSNERDVFKKNKERRCMFMKSSSKRVTSKTVATTASKILKDGRYGKAAKSVAGSALSQSKSKKK